MTRARCVWSVIAELAALTAATCGGRSQPLPTKPSGVMSAEARAYLEQAVALMQAYRPAFETFATRLHEDDGLSAIVHDGVRRHSYFCATWFCDESKRHTLSHRHRGRWLHKFERDGHGSLLWIDDATNRYQPRAFQRRLYAWNVDLRGGGVLDSGQMLFRHSADDVHAVERDDAVEKLSFFDRCAGCDTRLGDDTRDRGTHHHTLSGFAGSLAGATELQVP